MTTRTDRGPGAFWRDDSGAVLSVDFMLTVPVFLTVFMCVLQTGLLLAARFVVEEAAFAACRSAVVWIPATLPGERHNRMNASGAKLGHVEDAAADVCAAVAPRVASIGAGRDSDSLVDQWSARLPAAHLLTSVDFGAKRSWRDREDVTVVVEHRYALRVPIARYILDPPARFLHLPPSWTLRASATLTNQGRAYGARVE